jgi:hypothetical protein
VPVVAGVAVAGAGFLLAVVWFDLMFDVQALRQAPGDLPEAVLASTAAYYARVTTAARPMNRFVALAMVATLAGLVGEIVRHCVPRGVGWSSLALVGAAVTRADDVGRQSALARSILRDHVFCFSCVFAALVLQVGWGR